MPRESQRGDTTIQMRITGGVHRSRTLIAPKGRATRPTSDRVREALFGILTSAGAVDGARVLDLYAGTGALALEALSRGASSATLVESAREAVAALRANIAALRVEASARVLVLDLSRGASRVAREADGAPFDLVLADPPWALVDAGEAPRVLSELAAAGAFTESAWIVLEHAARTPPPEVGGLCRCETRSYGDTALTFYKTGILAPPRTDVSAGPPSD
jgi:16S rRNA (guanine966-N2)-methyltransferase